MRRERPGERRHRPAPTGPVEWSGGLVETGDKIKTKDLLTKKKTKIAGQLVVKYPNKQFREPGPTDTTGTTTLVLKVTITRAK